MTPKQQLKLQQAKDLLVKTEKLLNEHSYFANRFLEAVSLLSDERTFMQFYVKFEDITFDHNGNTLKGGQPYLICFNGVMVNFRWWKLSFMIPYRIVNALNPHQSIIFSKGVFKSYFEEIRSSSVKKLN